MATNFVIFSTEQGPMMNPLEKSPSPTVLIDLKEDPMDGFEPLDLVIRGSKISTIGGAVYQEWDRRVSDGKIKLAANDAEISDLTYAALVAAFSQVNTLYYLTDGISCWGVRFARPTGLNINLNRRAYHLSGRKFYKYEINLHVISVMDIPDNLSMKLACVSS